MTGPEVGPRIAALVDELGAQAREREFSGVVLVEHRGDPVLEYAGGWANRAESIPMTMETPMATASATKGFTALAVASLIDDGVLKLDTPIRDVVGDALPRVHAAVTIEQLLGHTSGVGDYLDEEELESSDEHVLDVSAHVLEGPEDYLPLLDRHEQVEPPGSRFRYNNAGYVMLALAIERASGRGYHDEVRRRVFDAAEMTSTDFLRSDRLPAGAALGYLTDGRTNVFHLPVIGTGDGGAYTTAPDMMRFWDALRSGRIVDRSLVATMTTPTERATVDFPADRSYGLGFWIAADGQTVMLEGHDAGVSMRSGANRRSDVRFCLISNNASDVWPLARVIDRHADDSSEGA